jgi:2-dehydropantoate 2-reductase
VLDGLVLNSVDPAGVISAAIPPRQVVGCVVYSSTEIVSPGVIRHVEGTRFSFGEPDRSVSPRCTTIADAFKNGGLKAPVERELRNEIWLKLLGNATFNPISAITRTTLGRLGSTPAMRTMLLTAFEEIAAVADRLGVTFPVSLTRRLEAGLAVGDHKTSMLQDLENGKPLEYQCMTGAVLEIAERVGVAVPHIAMLHACIELIDKVERSCQTIPLSKFPQRSRRCCDASVSNKRPRA